jgi:hypothetical protein
MRVGSVLSGAGILVAVTVCAASAQVFGARLSQVYAGAPGIDFATGFEFSAELGPRGAPFAVFVNYQLVRKNRHELEAITCDVPLGTNCILEPLLTESSMRTWAAGLVFDGQASARVRFAGGIGLATRTLRASAVGEIRGGHSTWAQSAKSGAIIFARVAVKPGYSWPIDVAGVVRMDMISRWGCGSHSVSPICGVGDVVGWSLGLEYKFSG